MKRFTCGAWENLIHCANLHRACCGERDRRERAKEVGKREEWHLQGRGCLSMTSAVKRAYTWPFFFFFINAATLLGSNKYLRTLVLPQHTEMADCAVATKKKQGHA